MLEGFFEQIAKIQERFPWVLLAIALLITLFMGYYAIQLETDSRFDTLYREDSDMRTQKSLVSSEFGRTDTMYVIAILDSESTLKERVIDIRDPQVLESLWQMELALEQEPNIDDAITLSSALMQVYGRLPETLEESKEMISRLPFDVSRVLSEDMSATNVILEIDVPNKAGALEEFEAVITKKIADIPEPIGVNFQLTGEASLLSRIMHLLIADNLRTVGFALLAVVIILWFYFRSADLAFISTSIVTIALTWLAGTIVLLDIRISMMTAAIGAMMVGMGVDYSIHMAHGYHEELHEGTKKPILKVVPRIGGALLVSAMTTIAGFYAMTFGMSPSSQMQGFILATGIFYAFLSTLLVLPPMLTLHRRFTKLKPEFLKVPEHGESWSLKFLRPLARLQVKRPASILVAFIVITILLVPGFAFVRMDTSNENWLPENDPVLEALDEVGARFGSLESQNFLLQIEGDSEIIDLRDPGIIEKIGHIDEAMESLSYVDSFSSPADRLGLLNDGRLPQEREEIKQLIEQDPELREMFNEDYTLVMMNARSDSFDAEKDNQIALGEMMGEAEAIQFPEGTRFYPQGNIAQWIELDETLAADTMFTTLLGFLFVIIIASLVYRSLLVGMLAFLPIIFSLLWTVGIMGYIDLPFTVLTSGMMAIVMGMGVDFSVHLIHITKLGLKKGLTMAEAITQSVTKTGEAISTSTLTTVIGLSALMLANLLATQRLGATLAIAISMCFLACILLVPASLMLEDKVKRMTEEAK
jgi:hydrophobe/amphiphile efflux-3 (HAE3) family protein